ncbi:MAG: hypothetical protein Q9166_002574 [cf. Caloplaca sp. 2 TL-2023]
MSSQQRNYRPPTLADKRHRPVVVSSNIQKLEEAQWSAKASQPGASPTPTSPDGLTRAGCIKRWDIARPSPSSHEHLELQPSSFQHEDHRPPPLSAELTLVDRLERFKIASPTARELSEFHSAIDHECLLRSLNSDTNPTVSTGTLIDIALYLSGPLLRSSDSQSGRFRDVQLRALVAAFALLIRSDVKELTADPHDQLRTNIAERFNEITDGRRPSQEGLEQRMRKADALYLIRLTAQYFSLIERAQPRTDAVTIPIIGLVLAGASIAAGQYNALHSAFRYADQVIGLIPGRKSRYLNLPAIQELTRNAMTLLGTVAAREYDEDVLEQTKVAVGVVQLVQHFLRIHVQDIPSKKNSAWEWPLARFRLGPPAMDKWYFFYGLLDCVAQLARYVRPGQISAELLSTLKQLMEESEYDELRWKIIEIFQAYEPTRREIHQWLGLVRRGSNNDELAAVRTISRQLALTDIETISPISRQTTSSSSMNDRETSSRNAGSMSRCIDSRPLDPAPVNAPWRGGHQAHGSPFASLYQHRGANNHQADPDEIEPISITDELVLTRSTDKYGRSLSLASQRPVQTPEIDEADFARYLEGDLNYWPQDGQAQMSQLLPSRGLLEKGYAHAGLSPDCGLAFFYSETKVCVTRVGLDSRPRRREDLILERKYDRNSRIAGVSLSKAILAVSTPQNLELHRIGSSRMVEVIPHGKWDPSGIATCDQASQVLVAAGYRRMGKDSRKGHVVLYQVVPLSGGRLRRNVLKQFTLPTNDFPKCLSFDSEGASLVCITGVGNSVIIWNIGEGAPEDGSPTTIARYHHIPETGSDGLTSAAIYKPQIQQAYLVCTTSASTERFRSQGEWPFVSPLVPGNEEVSPRTVHDLIAFQNHRQIVAATVSSVANKLAVLTQSGKILTLDLTGHEEGGICSRNDTPVSVCKVKNSEATPTCLRFDPSGTRLFAVDPEGNLVVVMFRPDD